MDNEIPQLILQVVGLGALSFLMIALHLRTYRNPEWIDKNSGRFLNEWSNETPEDKQRRYQEYRKKARLWLIVSIIPLGMFLLSCLNLILAVWLSFR
jgi:hypothetical protein